MLKNDYIQELACKLENKKQMFFQSLLSKLEPGATIKDLSIELDADGTETVSFKGKKVMEFLPVEFLPRHEGKDEKGNVYEICAFLRIRFLK